MTQKDDFHALLGPVVLEWREGFASVALDVMPHHLNRVGILHGGVLLSLLDEVAALSGIWCSVPGNRRSAVTVDLTGHFTGQAKSGRIIATAECVSRGRSMFFVRSEVRDAEGKVISYGTSTHKWRRGSETVEGFTPT